jgi:hypothetical protein
MDISSTQKVRELLRKNRHPASVASMMSIPCTSLRFGLKKEVFACGNARDVTPAALMKTLW